jgi:predicted nucleotidyltransferase
MKLAFPEDRIAEFCRKWKIVEFALFGSVLRDDFRPDSDVDVLVTFAPGTRVSLFAYPEMQSELGEIFGRPVDLLTRRGVETSPNPYRRKSILDSARVFYAAA